MRGIPRLGIPWLSLQDGPQGFRDGRYGKGAYGKGLYLGTATQWPSGPATSILIFNFYMNFAPPHTRARAARGVSCALLGAYADCDWVLIWGLESDAVTNLEFGAPGLTIGATWSRDLAGAWGAAMGREVRGNPVLPVTSPPDPCCVRVRAWDTVFGHATHHVVVLSLSSSGRGPGGGTLSPLLSSRPKAPTASSARGSTWPEFRRAAAISNT